MRLARRVIRWFGAYALILTFAFVTQLPLHRRDSDRAFSVYYKNPSPENEAALRAERRKNEIIQLKDSAIISFVLLVVGYGLYAGLRWVVRIRKPPISSENQR